VFWIGILQNCFVRSLKLREKHRLREFENWVLRIFGRRREEAAVGWRGLYNELHNFYASPNIIIFFSTGFYSPFRNLAFLNGLLDPQTFGRTPWLGDQSNTRPQPEHRTTQHRNTQTHFHAPSRIRT
jgi:hypothetical protein